MLDRIEGRGEWSVKAFSDTDVAAASNEQDKPQSGREYLARRRQQTQQKQSAADQHVDAVEALHRERSQVAVAGRHLNAQDRALGGYTGEMLMNAAYLVDDTDGERFRQLVDDHGAPAGLRFEVAGPWPPYSFAVLE